MKLIRIAIISIAAAFLCSCAGSYERYQDEDSKHRPYDCADLHISKAYWNFNDRFGQNVVVTGKCSKGMKHGSFDFFVNDALVARTKYVRDSELKTKCYITNSAMPLSACMQLSAERMGLIRPSNGNNAPPPKPKSVWD